VPLQSSQALAHEAEIRDESASSADTRDERIGGCEDSQFGPASLSRTRSKPFNSEQLIRQALLLTLCDSLPRSSWIRSLSPEQWKRALCWLDLSGLALYFFDRITELQSIDLLPATVFASLEQRLTENTQRTQSMIAESIAIQRDFQRAGLWYAILKGPSLWPSSFKRPELRSQFDLDYLVADEDLPEARKILVRRGYRLYGASGRSWEFKRNERPGVALKDIYKDTGSWVVELHGEPARSAQPPPLQRLEWRELCGFMMPTLSPVDLFLGQGMHAFKHVCAEYCRAAHLIEFRRHILFRRDDHAFWSALHREASRSKRVALGLGVVILLIGQVTGGFAPEALTSWTVDCLPRRVRLWVTMYGRQNVFGSFPGSKLYLLLQSELEAGGVQAKRSLRRSLLPSGLPPLVIRPFPNESLSVRLSRYRMQLSLILSRSRFHLMEGTRFAWEWRRWRRLLERVAQ
jgi:hypothetical protein